MDSTRHPNYLLITWAKQAARRAKKGWPNLAKKRSARDKRAMESVYSPTYRAV